MSTTEGEAGRGELNNAATWDDFPNGRFGDFKSPAFGYQDLWGGSSISVRYFLESKSLFIYPFAEERNLSAVGQPETTGGLDTGFP
jgi:hypothetical protein